MASKVNTQHSEYTKMLDKWQRCRDTVAGQDAVYAAGERYLPRLKEQDDTDYKAYKLRAQFYNAVWRTISALSGMIFRNAPTVTVKDSVNELLEDVTMSGISFHILAQRATLEVLTTGRIGVLVDYPKQSVEGMTLADAQKLNLRPSMNVYPTETIINWKTARIGNKTVLSMVVLTEDVDLPVESEFERKTETRYRVLDLFNNQYRVRVFRISDKKEDEQVGEDLFPLMNGKPLDSIPFYFIGVDDTTPEMDEPPLIDLVDVSLTHYRLDADHKHGLHFGGLPTAVISGYTPENAGDKLYIGSAAAWVFPDPQASAKYLEYTGQGLTPISEEKNRLEQQMAILGARLLSSEKKAVETAQTAQIHRAGESSILSAIALTLSIGLTKALQTFSQWAGIEDKEAGITLNNEFMPPEVTPQELTAWVGAQLQGVISRQVVFWLMQQREMVPPDMTFEDMQSQIETQSPPVPASTKPKASVT